MTPAQELHLIYKGLQVAGYVGGGAGVLWGAIHWVFAGLRRAVKKIDAAADALSSVPDINKNVSLIMTNHLPHIQAEVAETKKQFETVRDDIKGVAATVGELDHKVIVLGVNQENNAKALHTLGEIFIAHIDKAKE